MIKLILVTIIIGPCLSCHKTSSHYLEPMLAMFYMFYNTLWHHENFSCFTGPKMLFWQLITISNMNIWRLFLNNFFIGCGLRTSKFPRVCMTVPGTNAGQSDRCYKKNDIHLKRMILFWTKNILLINQCMSMCFNLDLKELLCESSVHLKYILFSKRTFVNVYNFMCGLNVLLFYKLDLFHLVLLHKGNAWQLWWLLAQN